MGMRVEKQDKATIAAYVARLAAGSGRRSPIGERWAVEKDGIRLRAGR
jgi:hypothetical protein